MLNTSATTALENTGTMRRVMSHVAGLSNARFDDFRSCSFKKTGPPPPQHVCVIGGGERGSNNSTNFTWISVIMIIDSLFTRL